MLRPLHRRCISASRRNGGLSGPSSRHPDASFLSNETTPNSTRSGCPSSRAETKSTTGLRKGRPIGGGLTHSTASRTRSVSASPSHWKTTGLEDHAPLAGKLLVQNKRSKRCLPRALRLATLVICRPNRGFLSFTSPSHGGANRGNVPIWTHCCPALALWNAVVPQRPSPKTACLSGRREPEL